MKKNEKIYIAGHNGLVGRAIWRKLENLGFDNLIGVSSSQLNLTNQKACDDFFAEIKPDYVVLAAAKVGGIMANSTYPAEFIYDNLMISSNVIHSAYKYNVKKLLNLGSSCIYPRLAPQPMKENCLLTSPLETTNEAYAIAKISAIKLCKFYNEQYGTNFISAMPTNQYGMFDNFNMETAHLLPMLMRRFHLAKLLQAGDFDGILQDFKKYPLGWGLDNNIKDEISILNTLQKIGVYPEKAVVWGDGSVFRELMHSDDLADACVYLLQNKDYKDIGELVNVTSGDDIQLKNLIELVAQVVGYEGVIEYDKSKPNGTPRKLMDATKIKSLGWSPKISLEDGIKSTYDWYCSL